MDIAESVEDFVVGIRKGLDEHGFKAQEEEFHRPDFGIAMFLLSERGIWRIYGRLTTLQLEEGWPLAVGSGDDYVWRRDREALRQRERRLGRSWRRPGPGPARRS